MQLKKSALLFATALISMTASAGVVTLDGRSLTFEDAMSIARGEDTVKIDEAALKRVSDSYDMVLLAAKGKVPVYGLTTGVGMNKDTPLFNSKGELSQEVLAASKQFNFDLLRSCSTAYGHMMDDTTARLTMVLRLNNLLYGMSGAQPYIAELYRDFLNKGITPLIPYRGSVGEADIGMGTHVGAVMVGEWKAKVDGKVVDGATALKMKKIKPLDPLGKDALAILSSNAPSVAQTMVAVEKAQQIVDMTPVVFGLTLEGFNGNIDPFLPQITKVSPFEGFEEVSGKIRDALKGSYIWEHHAERALQDPLSFRTEGYALREATMAIRDLKRDILVQINRSDDNPATILNATDEYKEFSQVGKHFLDLNGVKGAIIPSSNFNPLPIAMGAQRLTITFTHLSHNSSQHMTHMGNEQFTGLTRWLIDPATAGYGFGCLQKPMIALHTDTMALAAPVSAMGLPGAGGIEDTFTNLNLVAERLDRVAENVAAMYGMELMNSTQAVDLRKKMKGETKFGADTTKLYKAFRQVVPYFDRDRIITDNIETAKHFVLDYQLQ